MQKKLLTFILILSSIFSFSQNDKTTILENFDKTGMETSILNLLSSDLEKYKNDAANTYNFYQIYKTIAQSDIENRLMPLSELKNRTKTSIIQLSILHSDYDIITEEAITNGSVIKSSDGKLKRINNDDIFKKKSITIATSLTPKKKGLATTYNLSSNDVFNTSDNPIKSINIDFDNDEGFKSIALDQDIQINYTSEGKKKLQFKITFADGSVQKSSSIIKIKYSNADLKTLFNRVVLDITATMPTDILLPYGEAISYPGKGEYEIFKSADDVLDKPIFLVDGFDPGDGRDIASIYSLLDFDNGGTTQNLGDLVRAEGFDIIILNFPYYTRPEDGMEVDGGADFVERNAMLLVELINIINTHPDRVGTEENVVIGPSMGGLISRYALNYMESESLDHETRLWMSFDSPHHGANVPIGFQHLFNYLSYGLDTWVGDFSLESLRPIVDGMLKSPAARQMLTDQFEPHLASGEISEFDPNLTLPIAHPFKDLFYNSMNNLTTSGFPENLRKASMINGSGEGNPYHHQDGSDVEPGDKVLDAFIPNVAFLTDAYFDVWFTPDLGQQIKIDDIWIDAPFLCFCDIYADASSKANSYSDGIDAASGGLFDLVSLAADFGNSDPTITAFFNALNVDYFNFIPSVSAMALEITNDEIDWFHTPSNLVTENGVNNTTPFDAWYMPIDNEPHVTVTPANFDFAWDEIVLFVLNTDEFDLDNSYSIIKNPVSNSIQIRMNKQNVENITAKVYAITGQEVAYKTFINPTNQIEISVNLSSGVYLLELNDTETVFKTKLIVQ